MSVLSIHIDESGNLNLTNKQNPEYCIAMVFHNQDDDISSEISFLDEKLAKIGWSAPFVHTMPLIRQDKPFETKEGSERKRTKKTICCSLIPRMCRRIWLPSSVRFFGG